MKNPQTEKTATACQKTPTVTEICGSHWKRDLAEQIEHQHQRDECQRDLSSVLPEQPENLLAQDKWMRDNAEPQAQHSPLPWHIGMKPGPIIYGPQGEQVADMRTPMLTQDEYKANARLIVASVNNAEKLAEALRELLRLVNHNEPAWNRAFDTLGNYESEAGK